MIDRGITSGERLCNLLNHRLLSGEVWNELERLLGATGRSAHLVAFYRQVVAVTLTGRIVSAGTSTNATFPLSDPLFRKSFTEHLRDTVGIPNRLLDEIYRASCRAVKAALEPIPGSVEKRMRAWAISRHQWCYICGSFLDFETPDPIKGYTCEHIWPRAYGGDSIEDNFLPACQSCNSKKKRHFATWAMPAVQSLLLGLAPTDQRLTEIDGSFKFSLHYRAAQDLAIDQRLTMKEAFLKIGPWENVRLLDADDVADFFNLENHAIQ